MKDIDIVIFTEEMLGIELMDYQKVLLRTMYKNKDKMIILSTFRRRYVDVEALNLKNK